jgi:hypothetical protein
MCGKTESRKGGFIRKSDVQEKLDRLGQIQRHIGVGMV